MSQSFILIPKLNKGDTVAIVSPSSGLPELFPWIQDLGLERLKNIFELMPVEYPTTRQMGSSLEDRAKDLEAAFSDPLNKAVIASIGGDDQIKLIKYLNPQIFKDNPKPFFGYSDNTHLHNFLWSLGIPSYYGGSIMTEFAFHNSIPEINVKYLKQAFFARGELEVDVSLSFNDVGIDWSKKDNLKKQRLFEPNEGLFWDGLIDSTGILWGGCVESLIVQCSTNKYLPTKEQLKGSILFIESAEDIPDAWILEYLLTGFGERGFLDLFQGVIVGRPKAWEFNKQNTKERKKVYREQQRNTVVKTIREYNKSIPIVQNLDIGHTAPQIVVPYGGKVRIDAKNKKIFFTY